MGERLGRKKTAAYLIYAAALGAAVGAFIWGFMRLLSVCIELVWDRLPKALNFPLYTLAVCLLGSVIIGLLRLAFGDYPETMSQVIGKVKKDGAYPYNNIFVIALCAFVPLVFGGSIGPEAGLTGVAVGLCFWVGDKLKMGEKNLKGIASLGISSALGVLFGAPVFGVAMDLEPETDKNQGEKRFKSFDIFVKVISALAGIGAFFLLGRLFSVNVGLNIAAADEITDYDRLMGIPFILLGILLGFLFSAFERLLGAFFAKFSKTKLLSFLSVVLGGLILGIIGTLYPLTMFSGEEQLTEITKNYREYAPVLLITTGLLKLFVTNVCICSDWKGGHFFPVIFSGAAIGCGVSMLCGTSEAMTVATVTAALLAVNLRRPVAVSLLLLLCFPARVMPWTLLASFAAAHIPIPNFLKSKAE